MSTTTAAPFVAATTTWAKSWLAQDWYSCLAAVFMYIAKLSALAVIRPTQFSRSPRARTVA
jgi:hypothetical protein